MPPLNRDALPTERKETPALVWEDTFRFNNFLFTTFFLQGTVPAAVVSSTDSVLTITWRESERPYIQLSITQLLSGESGSLTAAILFLLTSPWVFHMLGEDRTERRRTVCAACLTLQKEEPRAQSGDAAVRELWPPPAKEHFLSTMAPTVRFSLLQPRQARKANAVYWEVMASPYITHSKLFPIIGSVQLWQMTVLLFTD